MIRRAKLKNELKTCLDKHELEKVHEEIHEIEMKVSSLISAENTRKVKEHLSTMSSMDGSLNPVGFWKIK